MSEKRPENPQTAARYQAMFADVMDTVERAGGYLDRVDAWKYRRLQTGDIPHDELLPLVTRLVEGGANVTTSTDLRLRLRFGSRTDAIEVTFTQGLDRSYKRSGRSAVAPVAAAVLTFDRLVSEGRQVDAADQFGVAVVALMSCDKKGEAYAHVARATHDALQSTRVGSATPSDDACLTLATLLEDAVRAQGFPDWTCQKVLRKQPELVAAARALDGPDLGVHQPDGPGPEVPVGGRVRVSRPSVTAVETRSAS